MPEQDAKPQLPDLQLGRANSAELLAAIAAWGKNFRVREVRQIVRNPHCQAAILEELASFRHLTTHYEVRALITRHRQTPSVVAMRFVNGLFWRDLVEISQDVHLSGPLRHLAEKYLLERVNRLTPGERVSLARRAGGELLLRLTFDLDLRVVRAALDNARLTEERLVPLLTHPRTHPRILQAVATHPRWADRYEIRWLLCRHPLTPSGAVTRFLVELRESDLETLAQCENAAFALKFLARELLAERRSALASPASSAE